MTKQIAVFISPHGFGHAARASAVMAALLALDKDIHFEIFTQVPNWFFEHTLTGHFNYHHTLSDIGLVQKNALSEDLPATLRRLDQFLPFNEAAIEPLAQFVKQLECQIVICDIAPMGIAVARSAGIPSILIENFTWDWIYEGYLAQDQRLSKHIAYLQKLFAAADYHIQTEPVCRPNSADLTVSPISRKIRKPAAETRRALGISSKAKVVMVTMGGTVWNYTFLERLEKAGDYHFIIPGAAQQLIQRGNLTLLPHQSNFFHPDLINASDALVGKVGYSTLAEVYQAGAPYGYITREHFQETAILADYVVQNMAGLSIEAAHFEDGNWVSYLPDLLSLSRAGGTATTGAAQVAEFVLSI